MYRSKDALLSAFLWLLSILVAIVFVAVNTVR